MAEEAVLQATSAEIAPDGSTYVVLRWEAVEEAAGYNLYRSVEGAPPGETPPINGKTPITTPKAWVVIAASGTPLPARYDFTASARRCDRPRLYLGVPDVSV